MFGKECKIVKLNNDQADVGDSMDFISQLSVVEDSCEDDPSANLNVNPDIDCRVAAQLRDIFRQEYLNGDDEPIADNFEMKIVLKHDQPITFRPRRLSFAETGKLRKILDDLLDTGVIRPSDSPYASPIVLVPKKSGDLRLCVDYRELNKITVKDNFPTPLIDDNLDRLKDKKYFSVLDLKNGFHHVKIAEDSVKYTAFVTPLGQFEFLKMPFGLTNAPRVFQRYTNMIFSPLIRAGKILLYLDDLLIATNDLHEHLEILKDVFRLAHQYRLRFRYDKCYFARTEITYLGYLIDRHGIRPSKANIESVLNYPVPRNSVDLKRFLCLVSYFRRFIPRFSVIAKPLYDLVRKDAYEYGPTEDEIFRALKRYLTEPCVLSIYSPKLDTELHCDASSSGFGAVLLQKQIDGVLRPVSYFSQRTTSTESRYHSFELECLAVVYAIKRFHVYLSGIAFKVVTDCDSFRMTLNKQSVNPRISRWAMHLQQYDFQIEHRPGRRMTHVDALSRCHSIAIMHVEPMSFERILAIKQLADENIREIRDRLTKSEDKLYELRDGLVYRKVDKNKLLFYVPESMEPNVIRQSHDDLGHFGVQKVIDNIIKVYWFPKMRDKVKQYISNCFKCLEFSPISGKTEGLLHSIPKGNLPFQTIHIDHYGPLDKSGGFKHVLTVIDAFTRFVRLYPCKSTKTEEVIRKLEDYFRSYSKPRRIISDRGTAFTSNAFKTFVENKGIKHVLVAVGTPRANGQAERVHRSLTPMLAKLAESTDKWDRVLSLAEFAFNNTICRSTGETPSKLLFGIEQMGANSDAFRLALEHFSEVDRDFEEIRNSAERITNEAQSKNEEAYNRRHKESTVYQVGDYVLIRNVDNTPGVNKKLLPKFRGPYVVAKILPNDRYVVKDVEGFQLTQIPFNSVVGPDQMKPWIKI